jgi:amino acid transporter
MVAGGSGLIAFLIALGFVANAFQVACNSFIGVSRILVKMSDDGLLPQSAGLNIVDPLKHAPVRALWAYFFASVPWIVFYNFIPAWSTYSLGVTFACGYVFAFSALACTRIPSKMVDAWKTSELSLVSPNLIRGIGYAGFLVGIAMVLSYLVLPQLGISGTIPNFIVAAVIALSYLIYLLARSRSKLVDETLAKVPEEVEQYYHDKLK